jgi:hypothetical protein
MVKRTVKKAPQTFMRDALRFLEERDIVLAHDKPRKKFSGSLKEYIDAYGTPDKDGNLVVEFPAPVTINGTTYTGLMQQKKTVPMVKEEAALGLVVDKGLMKEIPFEDIRVYQWDALYRLNAQDLISDAELDEVMEDAVTWALQVIK